MCDPSWGVCKSPSSQHPALSRERLVWRGAGWSMQPRNRSRNYASCCKLQTDDKAPWRGTAPLWNWSGLYTQRKRQDFQKPLALWVSDHRLCIWEKYFCFTNVFSLKANRTTLTLSKQTSDLSAGVSLFSNSRMKCLLQVLSGQPYLKQPLFLVFMF